MSIKMWLLVIEILLIVLATCAWGKDAPTFYTPERIAIARENVEKYEWAQQTLDTIMKGQAQTYIIGRQYVSAEDYSAQSDEFMWELQPPTTISRVDTHEAFAECPIHGLEVRKLNAWHPWRIDPINHPYQVMCLLGKEWYPSNKFGEGDMTSGDFPDDGNGYVAPDGRHFYLIREYAHSCYCAVTIPCLRSLSQAWLLTGEEKYAHKCAILLARLASEYPNHDDRQDRLYMAPYGGTHPHYTWKRGGMITDLIWETFCTEAAVYAYDAIYDYLGEDPELITFLTDKGLPIENAGDLREYIEHYLLKAAATGLLNGAIHGNIGHHQALAMALALVMDDYSDNHPNSKDMVDFAYHGEGHCAYIMINGLYRDGGGHESPGYNNIKLDFIRVAQVMEEIRQRRPDEFPVTEYPDLFGSEKAASIFDYFIDLKMLGYFIPSIGDAGGIRKARRVGPRNWSMVSDQNIFAFSKYGDPRYARACTRLDGTFYGGKLFEPYPIDEIEAALEDPASEIKPVSRLLDGYGVGILESGEGEHRRAVALNYSAIPGHRQSDNLNLEVFARGVNILPDLGYPFSWDYTSQWDDNIMAHNTVSVGESKADQRVRVGNAATLFASQNGVHVVTAHHVPYPPGYGVTKDAAPDVDLYERTAILIDIDPERFYVVDLFAVNGGDQHDQSWHGPLPEPELPLLDWQQQTGTLAGPDVEQFATYTDRWGREWTNFPCYLKDIKRARLDQPAIWKWDYGLEQGDTLHLHVIPVGGPLEAIMGNGRSPARPADWKLDYLVCRRMVESGARSLFLNVIDAFQGEPVVKRVSLISEDPLELEVAYEGGSDRIQIATPASPSSTTGHRPQGVRVVSASGGEVVRDVQMGQYAPDEGPGYVSDTIRDLDYQSREIAIAYEDGRAQEFAPGRAVRIYNWGRSGLYIIREQRREGDLLWLMLDTTALLARGPVTEVEDGAISLSEYFQFATGKAGDDGKLASGGPHFFAGARLGEGDSARIVEAVANTSGSSTKIFLHDEAAKADLQADYAEKIVSVWEYGIGDNVELACVK